MKVTASYYSLQKFRCGAIIEDITQPTAGAGKIRWLHKSPFYPYRVIAYEVEWLSPITNSRSQGNYHRTICHENAVRYIPQNK